MVGSLNVEEGHLQQCVCVLLCVVLIFFIPLVLQVLVLMSLQVLVLMILQVLVLMILQVLVLVLLQVLASATHRYSTVCVFHGFSQSAQLLHPLRGHAAASGEEATSLSSCCSASRSGACPCHCQATSCSECANTATKYFEVFLLRALRRCAWTCLAQMLQPGAAWLRCCSKCHFVAQRHQRRHHDAVAHHRHAHRRRDWESR